MKAMYYEQFGERPVIADVKDPECASDSVIVEVRATGLCLSDWHGWRGHDPDIVLPHIPGHEFAGVIVDRGANVRSQFKIGQRVTSPFIQACGSCSYCRDSQSQVCPNQRQAGFTHWGSFAQFVEVPFANYNLIPLDDALSDSAAALLGCRFGTAFHAVMMGEQQRQSEWSIVFGCGGVGQSIVQIETSLGHSVIAVDRSEHAMQLARTNGAKFAVGFDEPDFVDRIRSISKNNNLLAAYDAFGSYEVLQRSLQVLDRKGRHIQVGLLPGSTPEGSLSLGKLIAHELEIVGCHGIARTSYPRLLDFLKVNNLDPGQMVTRDIALDDSIDHFLNMPSDVLAGVTMIRI